MLFLYTIMLLPRYPTLSQYHHQKYIIMLSNISKCYTTMLHLLLILFPLNISISFQLLHNSFSSPSIPVHSSIRHSFFHSSIYPKWVLYTILFHVLSVIFCLIFALLIHQSNTFLLSLVTTCTSHSSISIISMKSVNP